MCGSRKCPYPNTEGISLRTPPPPWIFYICKELMNPPPLFNFHKVIQRPPNPSGKVYFLKKDHQSKEQCHLQLCNHYWIKKCENAMKNLWIKLWKNLWTVQFHMISQMFFTPFSQGVKPLRPCEQGIFHRVRTYAKPCEKPCQILPSEKTCETPCKKPLNLHSVFHAVGNCKTHEQGIFHRVRACEKPSEMGGVYLAAACLPDLPPSPTKKTMLKSDCCLWVTGNPDACI